MYAILAAVAWALIQLPPVIGHNDNDVTAYTAAVKAYREGRAEEAITAVRSLDRTALKRLVTAAAEKKPWMPFWNRQQLLAAGMLHVDTALGFYRMVRSDDFNLHAELAAKLFAAADASSNGEPAGTAGRRSALAIGSLILGDGHVEPAYAYLTRAVERFPDDAPLLVALGTTIETSASGRSATGSVSFNRARAALSADLNDAAKLFDRAIAADAASVEARVRRAHVCIQERNDAHAASLLEQALAREPPPAWTYLASLMLGGVRERAGDASGAADLYTAALKAYPQGQSAFVALSALRHRTGSRDAAADTIDQLFAQRLTVESDDPWWNYRFGRWQEAEPELAALRAEVRR